MCVFVHLTGLVCPSLYPLVSGLERKSLCGVLNVVDSLIVTYGCLSLALHGRGL